jgi:hypothetical protein
MTSEKDLEKEDLLINVTRYNFLLCAQESIQNTKNNEVFGKLVNSKSDDGIQKWRDWQHYPRGLPNSNLKDGPLLDLIAWLVYYFMGCVSPTFRKTKDKKLYIDGYLFTKMTCDDLAYTYVLLESNIDHWLEVSETERKEGRKMTKKEKQAIDGYEFSQGSGMSGKEGMHRFNSIKKFMFNSYYNVGAGIDKNSEVKDNQVALLKALQLIYNNDKRQKNKPDVAVSKKRKDPPVPTEEEMAMAEIKKNTWATDPNQLVVVVGI